MKNTLMVLLASLVLAVCLTACGGGQTTGVVDGQTGSAAGDSVNGGTSAGGSVNDGNTAGSPANGGDIAGGGVTDGARDALDDAGRSVRNAMDDAGDAMDSVF